jgi:hypothetical protein
MASLLNFALEYVARKIQENQERMKLNVAHPILICADRRKQNYCKDNLKNILLHAS